MSDLQGSTISTTENPKTHIPETFVTREVSRLVDHTLHQEGASVANFRGDLEEMLADGEFYGLNPRDLRLLTHLYRTSIRRDATAPDGAVVSMSNRQWGAFIGIRRTFLFHRRNPSNLINLLRTRRAVAETMGERAVLTPITENETLP